MSTTIKNRPTSPLEDVKWAQRDAIPLKRFVKWWISFSLSALLLCRNDGGFTHHNPFMLMCVHQKHKHHWSPAPLTPTWPVVVGGVPASCCQTLVRRQRRPQSSDHFHHVGQDHVTGADCAAAFEDGTVRLLLYVQVWFDGYRPPTTQRVYGDLLVVRTEGFNHVENLLDIKQRQTCRSFHLYQTYFWM